MSTIPFCCAVNQVFFDFLPVSCQLNSSNGAAQNSIQNYNIILIVELDLDFLERRHHQQNATTNDVKGETCSPVETSPEYMDLIKIILLGAPAVGKTSIIQVKPTKNVCFFKYFFDLQITRPRTV